MDVLQPFSPNLFLCAPRLEKLEISVRRDIPRQPIAITDGDKLPLHTLRLANCSLSWSSLNLSGLKSLVLYDVRSPSPPNMVEFLAVLSSMQNFTVLHLKDVLPSSRGFLFSGGLDNSPKIHLPRLAFLAVIEQLSTVVALLSCINIPSEAQLTLEPLLERGSSIEDYAPISSFLAQRFRISEQL